MLQYFAPISTLQSVTVHKTNQENDSSPRYLE